MLFNSLTFLIFFFIVFILYWFILNKNLKIQNLFLLISSYIFYGWWDWRFLSLIIISSFVDYFVGLKIWNSKTILKKRLYLLLSLIINIGFLAYFKYFNFFVSSFIDLLKIFGMSVNVQLINIILPVGISFYTFQTLSYSLDIYFKKIEPIKDIIAFFAFVSFFPQLVAGPIERAKNLLPQFARKRVFDYEKASLGAKMMLIGFYKKIILADNIAILVDAVYNNPHKYPGFPMIIATFFFAFQIYCDFSGYSDIAIGTAKILGFDLMINFNRPYYSKSISEFWRRWHISLSSWFKDYVYIPLGGNRVAKPRWVFNLIITFLISGLWHGANWTFIIWGALHGLYMTIEVFTLKIRDRLFKHFNIWISKSIKIAITFVLVCFGWIFFRAKNVNDAFYIISKMFSDIPDYFNPLKLSLKFRGMGLKYEDLIKSFIFIGLLLLYEFLDRNNDFWDKLRERKKVFQWVFFYTLLIIIIFYRPGNIAQNFIYFQF